MKASPAFLTIEQVRSIHLRVVGEFGGDPLVRDPGLLASAVMMPAARFGGRFLHRGSAGMAAAYLFHLCSNHPFVDGNKRTALAAAEVFLRVNGASLLASDVELEELCLGVADGEISKTEVTAFFQEHVQ